MNPMSKGHKYLIEEMLSVSDKVYLGLGSCQEERTLRNPFSPKDREKMIRAVFPDSEKLIIFFLNDLGDCSKKEWNDYCLTELHKQIGYDANPTMYFGGCDADIEWWREAVNLNNVKMKSVSLCREENEYFSATEIRESLTNFLNGKLFHIDWTKHIPSENIEFVKKNYPRSLLS
jgi:hypothetical protein